MKLFKTIKRKVGNAIVPVIGSILGLTILAGAVVGVALNTSRIVYREDKLQKQNDARQILYIAAKYFCDQKNNGVDDSDIVAELQAIFGLGLKVTQNSDGSYYVWYPNSYTDGSNEYKETTDSEGNYVSSNVKEWLKAKITLTQNDADDGSGNKDAELNEEMFREQAKLDEKFAIGNLMTVYMTDEYLLPGRKWKLNEVSLVKSDIDTFDEAFTYFNNAGTLLIDDIGYALYAYKDITTGTGASYTTITELTDNKATYELVYSTDYIGGNYYWQNSNKVDTTTWIYKQEYDMEMLAGMLNLYYKRAHKTNSSDITTESTVYYEYQESTGKHILKASEDETDPEKIIICNTNLEFAEKLSFYVFWVNMPRLCLELNDFVEALLDTFDPDRNEARYEYIWTDKGLTVNAYHRGGNYWPYYFTMSQIEDILFSLGMSTEYKYVAPTLVNGTYNSQYSDFTNNFNSPATTTIDGKEYALEGYDVKPSNTYKGESYEVDIPGTNQKKTYHLFYTKGIDESAPIKYFDSYRGDYFTYGGKAYKFDLENTGKNNPGTTKEAYLTYGSVIYADERTGTQSGTGSDAYYGYSKDFEYEGKNIHSEYRCYDNDKYYDELYRWIRDNDNNYGTYTDPTTGNTYTLQNGNYARCYGRKEVTIQDELVSTYYLRNPSPSYDAIDEWESNPLDYVPGAIDADYKDYSYTGNYYKTTEREYWYTDRWGNDHYYTYDLYHYTFNITFTAYYDYKYAVLNGIPLRYQTSDRNSSAVENGFTSEYHSTSGGPFTDFMYNNGRGIWRKYRSSVGKYRYYYFPQYAYRELEEDTEGPFYYGYAQYECTETPEFDYEKMYSRLLSMKELDLSKQYSGGRELNNVSYRYLTDNVTKQIKEGQRPEEGSKFRKLYDDIYQYAWDTIVSTYAPTDGGVPSLLGGTDLVSEINSIENLKIIDGADNYIISFHVKYDRYKPDGEGGYTDEIERNQDYYMEQGKVGVEPFTFTFEEFKAQFMEGILVAMGRSTSALLDPEVQYTIKTRSEKEVLEDLVTPIRYQYLPTTKYYEIFGNTGNKQGFKEEQLYNKLLSFYFESEEDDTIYKYKSVTYSTDATYS
ncbi:MAG: hypothetical protein K6E24_01370, partial [bacterium]|nr:hypothetical protein [bacterium]